MTQRGGQRPISPPEQNPSGREARRPLISVLDRVETALGERQDWRAEVARTLARQLDEDPNASTARELRALMGQLEAEAPAEKGTALDELARRRAAR